MLRRGPTVAAGRADPPWAAGVPAYSDLGGGRFDSAVSTIEVARPVPGRDLDASHAMKDEFKLGRQQQRPLGGLRSLAPATSNCRRGTRRPTLGGWCARVFRFWRRAIRFCCFNDRGGATRPGARFGPEPRDEDECNFGRQQQRPLEDRHRLRRRRPTVAAGRADPPAARRLSASKCCGFV